jgi:hypothetical protein
LPTPSGCVRCSRTWASTPFGLPAARARKPPSDAR